MRLLNTKTMATEEFFDHKIPPYAILSHRWERDELSYQDLLARRNKKTAGFIKVQACCKKARADGFQWVWVDTCCIDKTSSAELSEAINAMFRWYKRSSRCYAYLCDVDGIKDDNSGDLHWPDFEYSAWFTRGWTLQELIAPSEVLFLDRGWREIGTRTKLMNDITAVTGIPERAFRSLNQYSTAQIMSWASRRETSRVEDLAYCLLGLFNVGLPLLYGEGERAFRRLQEEIIRTSDDETVFVWANNTPGNPGGLFAPGPNCFEKCGQVWKADVFERPPYALTNKGLQISVKLLGKTAETAVIPLNCTLDTKSLLGMCVTIVVGGKRVRTGYQVIDEEVDDKDSSKTLSLAKRDEPLEEIFISITYPGVRETWNWRS